MKLKSYLFIALAALTLASCDDDFGDWANVPSNEQGAVAAFGNGTVAPVGTIDFRTVADDVTDLKVCDITAPTSSDSAYATTYQIKLGNTLYNISADGNMSRSELETYVNNTYGKRPVERDTKAVIIATLNNGSVATRLQSDSFDIKTIAKAPVIEQRYYITGNINGWSNTDTTYPVVNGGGDPYDDPIFTVLLDATGKDIEFKLTPESGLGGDWSNCITASADGAEGKLADHNVGGNLVIKNVEGAKKYRVTFNLLDQTWSYEALNFTEFIYEIGNESGWATSHALYGANYDGNYLGYYYLNGEFKFKPNADNWDNDWEYNGEGKIANIDGGSNVPDPGAGFYRIEVNTANLTYSLTKISNISIVGDAVNGWTNDQDMTYNTATGNWEWTGTLAAGELKFRANHDWAISWGGKSSKTDLDNLTENNGNNLSIAEAGTYKIVLTIHQEKNDCKVSIQKQ